MSEVAAAQHDLTGLTRVDLHHLVSLQRPARSLSLAPGLVKTTEEGPHLSLFKGRGMEYAETRPYQEGDDIRQLDWRVMARTGKPYTKLFREERERPVLIWLDLRRDMHFATRGAFKAVRASEAAALLAWAAHAQGDRVGAVITGAGTQRMLRPRRSRPGLLHLLGEMARHPAWDAPPDRPVEPLQLAPLHRLAQPGSLIILVSDFRHADTQRLERLRVLARHSELLFVFVHDPFEALLPEAGILPVTDGRHEALLDSSNPRLRSEHADHFEAHREQLARLALQSSAPLITLRTDQDPVQVLRHRLHTHG